MVMELHHRGGGGYFGGGGGDCAGGGGGSAYVGGVTSNFSKMETATGVRTGSGYAIITLLIPPPTPSRSPKPYVFTLAPNYPFLIHSLYVLICALVS